MKRYFDVVCNILLVIIKAMAWLMLHTLYAVLELLKIFLLLLCMAGRIFLAFVRAGTTM